MIISRRKVQTIRKIRHQVHLELARDTGPRCQKIQYSGMSPISIPRLDLAPAYLAVDDCASRELRFRGCPLLGFQGINWTIQRTYHLGQLRRPSASIVILGLHCSLMSYPRRNEHYRAKYKGVDKLTKRPDSKNRIMVRELPLF